MFGKFKSPQLKSNFKIGVLVLVVAIIVAAFTLTLGDDPSSLGGSRTIYFRLLDATGIVKGNGIYVAGIQVGAVRDIKLRDGYAVVETSIGEDILLRESGIVELRSRGILGDKNIVFHLGNPKDPILEEGGFLKNVKDSKTMTELMSEISRVVESLKVISEQLQKAADKDQNTTMGRMVANLDILSRDLTEITLTNKDKLEKIIQRAGRLSDTIDEFLNDPSENGFKSGMKDARFAMARIENVTQNIKEITEKINRGEGTIGKLFNDEDTIDHINSAIDNVNNFMGGVSQMQTTLDFSSWYLSKSSKYKSFIGLKIQPGADRYYLVQIVDAPDGVEDRRQIETSVAGGPKTIQTRNETLKDRLKISVLFAKNFFNITIKGGMIENTGGVGIDYFPLNDQSLRFTAEAYDLTKMQLRAYGRYDFAQGVYVTAGVNNILSKGGGQSEAFVGAGFYFTNDDVLSLIRRVDINK